MFLSLQRFTCRRNDVHVLFGDVSYDVLGGGRGGGIGNLEVFLVRVCEPVFRNLPHSYTRPLKKKRTHSYTRSSEMLTHSSFIYCPLIFFTHLLLAVMTNNAVFLLNTKRTAGLGGSVGCAVRLETRRSRVQPPPRLATFFRGD